MKRNISIIAAYLIVPTFIHAMGNYAPRPEEEIAPWRLVNQICAEDADESTVHNLMQSARTAPNKKRDELFDSLLDRVTAKNRPSFAQRKVLIRELHPWALANANQKKLAVAYHKLFDDMLRHYEEPPFNIILETMPAYYEADPQQAVESLQKITKQCVINKIFFSSCHSSSKRPKYPLQLFAALKQYNSANFNEYVQQALNKDPIALLTLAFDHPDLMAPFKGSCLSTESLIEYTLNNALILGEKTDEKPKNPFPFLLKHGQAHHVQYQDRIADILPKFLAKNYWRVDEVMALFESPAIPLRTKALSALIAYAATPRNNFWKHCTTNGLLASKKIPVSAHELHQKMYVAFKEPDHIVDYGIHKLHLTLKGPGLVFDYGIQKLLMTLNASAPRDAESQQLLNTIISEYCNVPLTVLGEKPSFSSAITGALRHALTTNSIPAERLSTIVATAQISEMDRSIDPEFLKEFKIASVLHGEYLPLSERCRFLDESLCEARLTQPLLEEWYLKLDQLSESPFKQYAQTLRASLLPGQTYFSHFAHRRALIALHEQNPDVPLPSCYPKLFSPFESFRETKPGQIHIPISPQQFVDPQFPAGSLCFGYVHGYYTDLQDENYRLYACDKKTGHPVWAFQCNEKRPYRIHENTFYCLGEDGTIFALNKENGEVQCTLSPTIRDPNVLAMHVTSRGTLYLVHEKNIAVIDLASGCELRFAPEKPFRKDHSTIFFTGEILAFVELKGLFENNVVCINGAAQIKIVEPNIALDSRDNPIMVGNHAYLICAKRDSDYKCTILKCIDSTLGTHLWTYSCSSRIEGHPILSSDGSVVFVVTSDAILALKTAVLEKGQSRELWNCNLRNSDGSRKELIGCIRLSDDGTALYGVSDLGGGNLCRLDAATGRFYSLYELDFLHSQKLLDVYQGTVYLQGG